MGLLKLIFTETYTTTIKMDTCQLLNSVNQDEIMSKNFLGVFPRDMIPSTIENGSLIANTDSSEEKGTHWVAMYKENNICDFFDSYGRPPFKNNLKGVKYNFNHIKLQSNNSQVCGQFCLYFLYYRSRGVNIMDIAESLKSDGDYIVKEFVETNFEKCDKEAGLCCQSILAVKHQNIQKVYKG